MIKTVVRVPPVKPLPPRAALCVFVVARPRAGKSTVAAAFERALGVPYIESSVVLNEILERDLHLPAGTIAAARAINSETWRPELVAAGNAALAVGAPAGLICVQRGFRIVDGIRKSKELHLAMAEARKRGLYPLTLFVESKRALGGPKDNTQALALLGLSHVVLHNDSTIAAMEVEVHRILARYSA
jgi:hypothetical protein